MSPLIHGIPTSVTTRSKGPSLASCSTSSSPLVARMTSAPREMSASATDSSNSGSSSATNTRAPESICALQKHEARHVCGWVFKALLGMVWPLQEMSGPRSRDQLEPSRTQVGTRSHQPRLDRLYRPHQPLDG